MKEQTASQMIDWRIIETASAIHAHFDNMELADFFHKFMSILALKIYEAAPSCVEAEEMMNDAIAQAKKIHIEQ